LCGGPSASSTSLSGRSLLPIFRSRWPSIVSVLWPPLPFVLSWPLLSPPLSLVLAPCSPSSGFGSLMSAYAGLVKVANHVHREKHKKKVMSGLSFLLSSCPCSFFLVFRAIFIQDTVDTPAGVSPVTLLQQTQGKGTGVTSLPEAPSQGMKKQQDYDTNGQSYQRKGSRRWPAAVGKRRLQRR